MSKVDEDFDRGVLRCVEDINDKLPGLTDRYSAMVVVSAFARHVGEALHLLVKKKMCSAADARNVLSRIERTAFLSESRH